MTKIDISTLRDNTGLNIIQWCADHFGPYSEERWHIEHLRFLVFNNDKDAVFTLLKWS